MANVYQPIVERFVSDLEALIQRSICDVIIGAIGQTALAPTRSVRSSSPAKRARKAPARQEETKETNGSAVAAPPVAPVVVRSEPVPPPRFVRLPPRGKARPQRKREESVVTGSPVVAPSTGPIAPIKRVRVS